MLCTRDQFYWDDQIKNEMNGTCSTCGKCVRGFGEKTRGKEPTWEAEALHGHIILGLVQKKQDGFRGMSQSRKKQRDFVNKVVNVKVPHTVGTFLSS